MNSLERFLATVERKPVDRPAVWLGLPDTKALPGLFAHFGGDSVEALREKLGDDFHPVELPYHSPVSDHIYAAFDFAKQGAVDAEERTLTTPGYFEDCDDPQLVEKFDWPEPEKYVDPTLCAQSVADAPEGKVVLGVLWSAHFQDTCAAFGMESALVTMLTDPDVYRAVDEKIVDFYLRANRIFYEATRGKLHAVLIGNDMGSQIGLMLSPALVRAFVMPGAKRLVAQAKSYGLKVIYHSCGAISEIIPDLIEAGVDIVHPIQALAVGMEPERLKSMYGERVSFCGGVDAQHLLVNGDAAAVAEKVLALRTLFPTGLVISPSHEAILPDIRPENIAALFDAMQAGG